MEPDGDTEYSYDKTFEDCRIAAKDYENNILVSHMWKNKEGNGITASAMEARHGEMKAALGTMARNHNAHYDDTGYLGRQPNRVEDGTDNGQIAVATCPVSILPISIFPASNTGLLLMDPNPVFVSYKDCWSLYYQKEEYIPNDWVRTSDFPGYNFLRDHSEKRTDIAGKLVILNIPSQEDGNIYTKMREAIAPQIPANRKLPYLAIDPTDTGVLRTARKAYKDMMKAMPDVLDQVEWPEVDVNAQLENAMGIIVHNGKDKPPVIPPQDDESPGWSTILRNNVDLALTLYKACIEHKQLEAAMEGIRQKPTIVIYQPHYAKDPLVHFPPTTLNKQILKGVLEEKGYDDLAENITIGAGRGKQ